MIRLITHVSIFLLFVLTSCASTQHIVISDEMMQPVVDEIFAPMDEAILRDNGTADKPALHVYFCYDERFGEQTVTVISDWTQRYLEKRFVNAGHYKIIDRSNLERLIKEQKFQSRSGYFEDSDLMEVGRLLRTKYMVISKITRSNTLSVKVNESTSGHLIFAEEKKVSKKRSK